MAVNEHDTADYQQLSGSVCELTILLLQAELLICLPAGGQPGEAVPVHDCLVCGGSASAYVTGANVSVRGIGRRLAALVNAAAACAPRGGG